MTIGFTKKTANGSLKNKFDILQLANDKNMRQVKVIEKESLLKSVYQFGHLLKF